MRFFKIASIKRINDSLRIYIHVHVFIFCNEIINIKTTKCFLFAYKIS